MLTVGGGRQHSKMSQDSRPLGAFPECEHDGL